MDVFFDFIPFAFRRMFQHYEKGLRQVAPCEAQTWNGFFLERRPTQSVCLMSGALDEHTHEAVVWLEQQVFTSISLREMESLLDQNHEQNEREAAPIAEICFFRSARKGGLLFVIAE